MNKVLRGFFKTLLCQFPQILKENFEVVRLSEQVSATTLLNIDETRCVPVPHVVEHVVDVDEKQISTQDQHLQQTVRHQDTEGSPRRRFVYVRQEKHPKIVFRIGHGFLEGKVRVALLAEDTSIWEVGHWAWSGHCSLAGRLISRVR